MVCRRPTGDRLSLILGRQAEELRWYQEGGTSTEVQTLFIVGSCTWSSEVRHPEHRPYRTWAVRLRIEPKASSLPNQL